MNVLVLGASGYIGWPTVQALSRAGHIVYGLVRQESQAKKLRASEIIPVVGDAGDPSTWVSVIRSLDVVIDCTGGPQVEQLSTSLFSAITAAAKDLRPSTVPKLSYIYSSGASVHGDNRVDLVSETSILGTPAALFAWRPEFEQHVVKSDIVNGIVIRPGLPYGYSGGITAFWFKMAETGNLVWYGKPGGRTGFLHLDDLADLYVRVTEKALLVGGSIFDAANDQTEGVDDLFERMFAVIGVKGLVTYLEPSNVLEAAMSTTILMRPYLAKTLLGWQPKKLGLGDGLKLYYDAWKSSQ